MENSGGGVVRVGAKVCVFMPPRLIEGEIEKIFTACNERGLRGMGLIRASGAVHIFIKTVTIDGCFRRGRILNEAHFLQITKHVNLIKISINTFYCLHTYFNFRTQGIFTEKWYQVTLNNRKIILMQ